VGRRHELGALLDGVEQVDVAVRVRAIDEGELAGGARVAAVKEDGEPCVGIHGGDDEAVEVVRGKLAGGRPVDGEDGVVESRIGELFTQSSVRASGGLVI